jgi:hypothetical protein
MVFHTRCRKPEDGALLAATAGLALHGYVAVTGSFAEAPLAAKRAAWVAALFCQMTFAMALATTCAPSRR